MVYLININGLINNQNNDNVWNAMNTIKMLDASLRDGGHRTNFHFDELTLKKILVLLNRSGMDFIEVGYRNGGLHFIDNLGRAGICDKNYLLFCKNLLTHSSMAVMAHPENITVTDLHELKECGVDLLRICIAKNGLDKALEVIEAAKRMNLFVSANCIHMTYYTDAELDFLVTMLSQSQVDIIYLADSNGSIFPAKIRQVYQKYSSESSIPFGFHAHDNIGLAQANVLAALDSGVTYIDSSLAGMGKGIGNLKTEFFVAYLHAIGNKKYDLDLVVAAANYVRNVLNIGHEPLEMDEFTRGILNLSTADLLCSKK